VNTGFGYVLAFASGVFGAFHCLGMCGGIAGGFFVAYGSERRLLPQLFYHGTRILVYTVFGVVGASIGRVLVQTGLVGKGQGMLMMLSGVLIVLIGLGVLGVMPCLRQGAGRPDREGVEFVRFPMSRRRWPPAVAGLLNGLVPCSLVFSVAVKAVASADPIRAGLLMAAFGLGTLPTMAAVSVLGAVVGSRARGIGVRLAGVSVVLLGLWTFYEGMVFYDIMRGLSNW